MGDGRGRGGLGRRLLEMQVAETAIPTLGISSCVSSVEMQMGRWEEDEEVRWMDR